MRPLTSLLRRIAPVTTVSEMQVYYNRHAKEADSLLSPRKLNRCQLADVVTELEKVTTRKGAGVGLF